jgi:predicted metal-dependent hydrolase
MTITVDAAAEVSVAVPFYAALKEIHAFIQEKAHWIVAKRLEVQRKQAILNEKEFDHGHEFLFLGKKCPLEIQEDGVKRAKLVFDGMRWQVSVSTGLSAEERQIQIRETMLKWYRTQAEEILGGRIFHYSRQLGVTPKKIAVRTQKRVWGNCDCRTQTIHLNWQIILSPLEVVDYVVVHELCHLLVPNHSKRFWKKVEKILPDYRKQKKWLREHSLDMILP